MSEHAGFGRAAAGLSFAATPAFALMALLTAARDDGAAKLLCGVTSGPLGGMAVVYLLMSVFHAAHWLRLIAGRWQQRRTASPRNGRTVVAHPVWP